MTDQSFQYIAVVDTETNWRDEVMSLGVVIAHAQTLQPVSTRYYIVYPEYRVGGMFSAELFQGVRNTTPCSRLEMIADLRAFLQAHHIQTLFAYNAPFDHRHLPELQDYAWYDIMKLAANRNWNPAIPVYADCYGNGRLKRGYGVEPTLCRLRQDERYQEVHNALQDALDELEIMRLLGHHPSRYDFAQVKTKR